MDVYGFVNWCLVVILAVTLPWPVNIPVMALAYKVRQGRQPVDMEAGEFWWRCTFAALGLAGLGLVLIGLNYLMEQSADLHGVVQTVLFFAYLPAAAGYLFWMLALEDMLQASSVFLLYVLLPGLVVLLAGRHFHLWEKLSGWAPWLLPT